MLTNLLQSTLSEAGQSCGLSDSAQDVCYMESDNSQVRHRPMPPHHGIQATIPMTVPHLLVINEDVAHPVASLPAKTCIKSDTWRNTLSSPLPIFSEGGKGTNNRAGWEMSQLK